MLLPSLKNNLTLLSHFIFCCLLISASDHRPLSRHPIGQHLAARAAVRGGGALQAPQHCAAAGGQGGEQRGRERGRRHSAGDDHQSADAQLPPRVAVSGVHTRASFDIL